MGATPGLWKTAGMQQAYHTIFQFLNMNLVYKPEVLVAKAKEKFDTSNKSKDEQTVDNPKKPEAT